MKYFLISYDLSESVRIDRTRVKRVYHKLPAAVRPFANVFSNWEFQESLGSKLFYYSYFIQVFRLLEPAPTHRLTHSEFTKQIAHEMTVGVEERATGRVTSMILATIEREIWGMFIAKPVTQESKSCRIFLPCENLRSNNSEEKTWFYFSKVHPWIRENHRYSRGMYILGWTGT